MLDEVVTKLWRSGVQALKDELRRLKGKALVDNAVTTPTIALEMLQIDVEPIDPRLLNNKTVHSDYLRLTQEQATILRELVEITITAEVPFRNLTALETYTPKPVVTLVYSKNLGNLNLMFMLANLIKSISANNKEPSKSWGSIVFNVPSSSLDECRLSKLFSGKSKKKPHKPKSKDTNKEKLYLLHMDLCGLMRVANVNGKKYILIIVDDYSSFIWVKCLRSKDEAPDFIIKFLKMIQVRLKKPVRRIRTNNGTEFVNHTLRVYYEKVGISHETSVARSSQQNGIIERRNHMLIEAARTMLIYAKALLFLWSEAVATACYTQNRSFIRFCHGKTPYELLHDKLPNLSFFHVFGALCYPTNDSKNLGKLQPKADIGIFIGYAPIKKAF
nr:integrase, catalytic region, zinc finger, CCHC-type, peptidase aspartic, catalytic [Tanacetum cinerariifolium]